MTDVQNLPAVTRGNVAHGGGSGGGIIDAFAKVSVVAKPTLDAALKLRAAREWLEDHKKTFPFTIDLNRVSEVDEDEAKARLAIIPDTAILQRCTQLFDDAVRKSAPKAWFHLALGAMLEGMPNGKNVTADYQFQIVDLILHGEESYERGCEHGFSAAIFVRAIRQVRSETDFVPGSASLLKACQSQRKHFRKLISEVAELIEVRENAEEALKVWSLEGLTGEDEAWYQARVQEDRRQGRVYVPIPDEELPF
jgi:hypothetical protein